MATVDDIKCILSDAAEEICSSRDYLCRLDAETGDGDHGLTMYKIGETIKQVCSENSRSTLEDIFYGISDNVLDINGGSIIYIWSEMANGVAESVDNMTEFDELNLIDLLKGALKGISNVSDAKPGDKTMVDTIYSVITECTSKKCSGADFWESAAKAAQVGAEATRNMRARFGRAKQLRDAGTGQLDPGAVSMSIFIKGIADSCRRRLS